MKNKAIIIPGLGDGVERTIQVTKHWVKHGLEPRLV